MILMDKPFDNHSAYDLVWQVFTDNEERPGEKRIYCMLFNNKHERLLTGSSVIDAWPLTRAVQDTMQVPQTHDRPINQVCAAPCRSALYVVLCSLTALLSSTPDHSPAFLALNLANML